MKRHNDSQYPADEHDADITKRPRYTQSDYG